MKKQSILFALGFGVFALGLLIRFVSMDIAEFIKGLGCGLVIAGLLKTMIDFWRKPSVNN
jgi:hypothetical protein